VNIEEVALWLIGSLKDEEIRAPWLAVFIGEVPNAPAHAVALPLRTCLPARGSELPRIVRCDRREVEVGRQLSVGAPFAAASTAAQGALLGALWG
jgi:hypothetical protein